MPPDPGTAPATRSPRPGGRACSLAWSALLSAAGLVACDRAEKPVRVPAAVVRDLPGSRHAFPVIGSRLPKTVPADSAPLSDDEEVIGVEAGGKARAYRMKAMVQPFQHVINDVVGGLAVTTTYCNITGCVRGFGGQARPDPLAVDQAGLLDRKMVLKVGHAAYLQDTGALVEHDPGTLAPPFPLAEYPLTRTTWRAWKTLHPHTDVYAGDPNVK